MADTRSFLLSSLPVLQMQMCLIFFGTLLLKSILCRFGIPKFTSMSIVGLIFATTFTKNWTGKMKMLFYFGSQENLGLISIFGYTLILFYIGVKTDMSVVHKTKSGVSNIASIAIIAPYLCSMVVLNAYSSKYLQPVEVKILGAIIGLFCMTPFPVISSNLSDLKILNSELGRIGLSASLVSEIFNVFLSSLITFSKLIGERGLTNALLCVMAAVLYILSVIFIIRPVMFWIIRQTPEVIVVTKFAACMITSLRNGMPWNDAICLSLIMSSKGIVEMAAFSLIRDSKGLPGNIFALVMICIIVNSTLIPMMLRYMYDPSKKYVGYIKRNITDLKSNSELRVLACIHRPENIPATINLLEATYPTKQEPISTYALQLIELVGRASPIFICHNLQRKMKSNSNTSMADKLLESFQSLEREFQDCLAVNAFTAISPQEMMYEDICTLALDKLTSLIILPFHRQWSCDGNSVELEDESLRDINYRVMERAPCGKDDREALFFTKRMTKNPHVKLTVVRFLSFDDVDDDSKGSGYEGLLDNELLDEIKTKNKIGNVSVKYVEKTVKDGPETALIVRSLVTEFDLIVVGRQAGVETTQTSGLLQWSEYSELGVLGDLLVSTDAGGTNI
ncbi:hypothetical protein TSUD_290340 [Trifolium subterraneum]|uniref:Uncharacterized protein n=1 Tax=Trifolium subterraneum TaxID=3900 RepID=A0A2Z6M355_TRISU|nr:hypothetical protein TSUD_290340 [Trifolium subterraneum]